METFKILALLLFAILPLNHFSQMVNGGFETYDGVSPDSYQYSIEYAAGWHNLNNSCDLIHPSALGAAGTPRTGVGCARLGWNSNSNADEYFYGTTNSLTSGTTYVISFWVRKDYSNSPDYQIGAYISSNTPTPMITSPTYIASVSPQVIEPVTSTVYKKVSFCYTASQSGVHYITFGSFKQNSIPTDNYLLFYVDDVSVEVQGISPVASIAPIPNLFCSNASIILDGTSSSSETEYEWNIYENTSGSEVLVYDGARISGNAGVVNASVLLGSNLQAGSCYRAYLTVYNGCGVTTFVDFCIEDPSIDFITDGNPVCEGQLINLVVTGDDGWTYTWFQGGVQLNSGIGLKNLNVTPTIGNSTFTVTVTTPAPLSCTSTQTLTLIVHSLSNQAPSMNGINGGGEYTYYVNAGSSFNFTSNVSNDNSNEQLNYFVTDNIPASILHNISSPPDGQNGGTMSFTMSPNFYSQGIYTFSIKSNDQNACNPGISTYTFTIIVVCDHCPICVSYEDRGPAPQVPLPLETKAGKCIIAGWSADVSGGTNHILFQAGEYISLGDFFDSGTDYEAIIEPTTCVTDCEDCCTDWAGFTYDPIQNIVNFGEENPAFNIWQMTDINNPFCAFGAKGFSLAIIDQSGSTHHSSGQTATYCCPFESPAPENPIIHSPIWWDGYTTNIFGNQVRPSDGYYYYLVTLFGCNGESVELHGFFSLSNNSGMIQNPNDPTVLSNEQLMEQDATQASLQEIKVLNEQLSLSPNPTTEYIEICGLENNGKIDVHLLDASGTIVKHFAHSNGILDVSDLANGTYYARIYVDEIYVMKKFVKQ